MTTISITGEPGVSVTGDGVQLAQQFRDRVLHPLCLAISQNQGDRDLVAFQTCLILQLMNDIRVVHGQPMLDAVIEHTKAAVAHLATKQGH